jgi:hypothetical protein
MLASDGRTLFGADDAVEPGLALLLAVIFLALELPLALIALRSSRRPGRLAAPGALYVLGVIVPNGGWKFLLLGGSLLVIFGSAIRARFRATRHEDERLLSAHGRTQWVGQSRRDSMTLIAIGVVLMAAGTLGDALSHARTIPTVLLFGAGSISLGLGLVRRHIVLVLYFGKVRAAWLEVLQIITVIAAYALAVAGELSADPETRLLYRVLSLIPFALHFVVVWLPLIRAQEQPVLPETPFA